MLVFGQPRERGNDLASRPSTYPIAADAEAELTHSSANFSVTWIHDPSSPDAPSLKDRDGDGVPDSVEVVLNAFETARTFLLSDLGYPAPPTTGPTRIYVAGVEDSALTRRAPGGRGLSRPSFFIIGASALPPRLTARQLRIIAAHEYFHAIQNGYNSEYEHWIGEATATWMEDVFDDRADPNHDSLADFVPYPRRMLTDVTDDHEYGAFLFIQFLVEWFGRGNPGVVRELWEQMAVPETGGPGEGALEAIESVLARRGVTFERAWAEFLLWRWDLDRFEEGEAYQATLGNQWPKPLQNTQVSEESCRLSSDRGSGLPPLSGDYSVFRPANKPDRGAATLTVEGPAGATGFALVKKEGGEEKVQLLEIGEDGLASARVRFGDDDVKRVVLGVANPARNGPPTSLGYSLRIVGGSAISAEPVSPPPVTHLFGGLPLRGRVLCNGQPSPLTNVILVHDKRSGEQRTYPLTTDAGGFWSLTIEPGETSTYRFEVVDPLLSAATSASWDVAVRVGLSLDAPTPHVPLGQPVVVEGKVTPPHPGAVVAIEYRRPELSWRAGQQTTANADGDYRAEVLLPATGIWELRATVVGTGDDDHVGNTTVHDVVVNVG